MSRRHHLVATASALMLGASLLAVTPPPVVLAGSSDLQTCRVRNLTQETHGRSFKAMVAAAVDGDRLTVRGTCLTHVGIGVDIAIRGAGDHRAVLDAQGMGHVLKVRSGAVVRLRRLVITNGDGKIGGGIVNRGTLTLTDTRVRDNRSKDDAGGIWNLGDLTLIDSIVVGNIASGPGGYGGGISSDGAATLINSIVRGNHSSRSGGGIANYGGGTMTLEHSKVTANRAPERGGGIYNEAGTVTLRRSSSVATNTAGERGGGIWNDVTAATVHLSGGSTVTGNTPDDCVGTPAC